MHQQVIVQKILHAPLHSVFPRIPTEFGMASLLVSQSELDFSVDCVVAFRDPS